MSTSIQATTSLTISGFMQGEIAVPDDFDQMGKDQIADLFEAESIATRDFHFNRKEANKR